jgi:hypothetical protein
VATPAAERLQPFITGTVPSGMGDWQVTIEHHAYLPDHIWQPSLRSAHKLFSGSGGTTLIELARVGAADLR